jgi:hypothetical protein
MMKPEAFKLRANTNNTTFGFEQVLLPDNDNFVHQRDGKGIRGNINNGEYDP